MATKKQRPEKPYPEYPLFPHAAGVWAKKIRGKLHYFGPWGDPEGSLAKYRDEVDDLQAGRTPRPRSDGLTVRRLANEFLSAKKHRLDSGELSPRMFADYQKTCALLIDHLGSSRGVEDVRPEDFRSLRAAFAKGPRKSRGLVMVANLVRRTRTIFKFAYDADLIERPLKFGTDFKPPSPEAIRKERQRKPKRGFSANELRSIIDACGVPLRAMTLLAINCAFGPTDLARLPQTALDLTGGWVEFPRPKTGAERRARLWPETVSALRRAIAERPMPRDESLADLVFVTQIGQAWVRAKESHTEDGKIRWTFADAIGKEFNKVLVRLKLKHEGANFYGLRHTFRTVADETLDQPAVDRVMGHAPPSSDMAARYREYIADARLEGVAEYVRKWLYSRKSLSATGKQSVGKSRRSKAARRVKSSAKSQKNRGI